jgi:hypothetical protein
VIGALAEGAPFVLAKMISKPFIKSILLDIMPAGATIKST